MAEPREPNRFGQLVRSWRRARGWSQLQLANLAETTPRHLSFLETGRSRPGEPVTLRIARALNLPVRDTNTLLLSAGLRPAYREASLDEPSMVPFASAIRTILDRHEPYPGCAHNALGELRFANQSYRSIFPKADSLTPEEAIDRFFDPNRRLRFENWPDVAWAYADRWRLEASRTSDPVVASLAERVQSHLRGVPRPAPEPQESAVVSPRLRVDGQLVTTFSVALRFDTAREVTLSELRIELIFPADEPSAQFFRERSQRAPARNRTPQR